MGDRPRLRVAAIAGSVLTLDQAAKWWALHALDNRDIDLVWTLRLRLLMNKGSAFGFGSRYTPLITLLAIAVVMVFLRTGNRLTARWPRFAMGLVVGGAFGNLIDRLFRGDGGLLTGAVVDFIDLQWWPVFNIADMAIVLGAALLIFTAGSEQPTSVEQSTSPEVDS